MSAPVGFRRVLVGFDGSDAGGDALVLAQRLLEPGGELVLSAVEERGFRAHLHRSPRPGIADALLAPGTRARTVERRAASAARGLAELAAEEDAGLIVLGAHGGFDERTSPGPTALRLLHDGPCPIAVAPLGSRETEPIRHVGAAHDGSPESAAALAAAFALAARTGAAMSIFAAFLLPGVPYGGVGGDALSAGAQQSRIEVQERLDAAAAQAPVGVNPRTVLLHGDPAVLIAEAGEGVVDVLFAGSRGLGPIQRALSGSVSQALLLSASQPVVLFPPARVVQRVAPG